MATEADVGQLAARVVCRPLVVERGGEVFLSVEEDGTVVLRGQVVGRDKELAEILLAMGSDRRG